MSYAPGHHLENLRESKDRMASGLAYEATERRTSAKDLIRVLISLVEWLAVVTDGTVKKFEPSWTNI